MNKPTITATQRRYILALKDGPKSTHDLVLAVMVSTTSIYKMMRRLESLELVRSETVLRRGWQYQYELTAKGRMHLPQVKTNIQIDRMKP